LRKQSFVTPVRGPISADTVDRKSTTIVHALHDNVETIHRLGSCDEASVAFHSASYPAEGQSPYRDCRGHRKSQSQDSSFICGGEGGIDSRHPWRSPSLARGRWRVQNASPAVLSNPLLRVRTHLQVRQMKKALTGLVHLAEREGFEPSIRYRIHTFQACSFSRSDTSP
jgi:hypothetical protein